MKSAGRTDEEISDKLLATTNDWYFTHYALLEGNSEFDIPSPDEELKTAPKTLNADVELARILAFETVEEGDDNFTQLTIVLEKYLPRMDLAVAGLVERSQNRVATINNLNIASTIVGFILGIVFYRGYLIDIEKKVMGPKDEG